MNIAVDAGNTLTKVGIFEGHVLRQKEVFKSRSETEHFLRKTSGDHIIVSSVALDPFEILSWSDAKGRKLVLNYQLKMPIRIGYSTPVTLGVDRLAAACGAYALYPNQATLVLDIGTCLNYEFVDAGGTYLGGAISPGVSMRFEAMHTLTARLPLGTAIESPTLTGSSTLGCLQSGVMNGMLEEINGIIARYDQTYPGLRVILCGGDSRFFENHCKRPIFVAPDLVLTGLNSILLYHEAS